MTSLCGGGRGRPDWLTKYCAEHGVDLQYEDAITYAGTERGVEPARGEFDACTAAGLDVDWFDELDLPFDVHGGVRLPARLSSTPMPFLGSLIAEFTERDGRLPALGAGVRQLEPA